MATGVCIYCSRTLDLSELLDKAGKHRCRNEQDCLDYQTRDDSAAVQEDPDYLPNLVKSSLTDAARRIAAYGTAVSPAAAGEEGADEAAWMKSALGALALEYKDKGAFTFQGDERGNGAFGISFRDGGSGRSFQVKAAVLAGSRYALTVDAADGGPDDLYGEFIYRTYPAGGQEEFLGDLCLVLTVLEGEAGVRPALLGAFRREIEAKCHCGDSD